MTGLLGARWPRVLRLLRSSTHLRVVCREGVLKHSTALLLLYPEVHQTPPSILVKMLTDALRALQAARDWPHPLRILPHGGQPSSPSRSLHTLMCWTQAVRWCWKTCTQEFSPLTLLLINSRTPFMLSHR